MKYLAFKPDLYRGAVIAALCLLLSACGGGGGSSGTNQSAGVGGTGIVAGKTTGFGSIYVNGRRFDTDMSQFIVDGDESATQNDLALGMYVLLRVKTENGNILGEALEVFYDDEVQGPVVGISGIGSGETQRTFTVFGQNVTIDETSTIYDGTSFDGLTNGRLVEISGFRTSTNDITATYVEDKGASGVGSEVELRGTVSGYVPAPEEFVIDGVTIITDGMTVKDLDSGPLQNGMFVEVEGLLQAGGEILAREIEEENEDLGDEVDDVSLQGIISVYNGIDDFVIDGQPVDASGASLSPANAASLLGVGIEVEVEGDIVGGVLVADELELREGESEFRTTIGLIELGNNRFQLEFPGQPVGAGLGTVWVNVDGQTLFDDESAANLPNLSLDQLSSGDLVKVKGTVNLGEVDAEIVKRLDPPESTKIEGVVDAKVNSTSVTILGITYPVDPLATYEDENGAPMNATDFFNAIVVGTTVVELEDDEPDGDADELELDD